MANDKQSQRTNKYNGNKNVVIIGIVVGVLIVAILGTLFIKTNNNKSIKIDYDTYTTVTAKPGQEYTTKDKDGNLYYIKSDGMYCDTDYGQIKVEYHKPLNKFNTYSYTNEALTVTTFDINKDGTYTYTVYYTTGCRDVFTGKYDIAVGVNNAFKALNIKDKQEFTDAFFVDSGAIDPNNLVVLTMNKKSLTSYDENGKVTAKIDDILHHHVDGEDNETETSAVRSSVSLQDESILEQFVIYLTGTNDNMNAVAYSTTNRLIYNQTGINGELSVTPLSKGAQDAQ